MVKRLGFFVRFLAVAILGPLALAAGPVSSEKGLPAKRKALVMDLDGTKIRWQLFIYLIEAMKELDLISPERIAWTEETITAYRRRELSWQNACARLIQAYQGEGQLRGRTRADMQRAAKLAVERYGKHVHVFTHELYQICRDLDYVLIYISGSPVEIVEEFARFYDVEHFVGTEHPHADGVYTGGEPLVHARQKDNVLREFAHRLNLDLERSICIGDSEDDARMFRLVRYPICFDPNSELVALAHGEEWPMVVEKKIVYASRLMLGGQYCRSSLRGILPAEVAERLLQRLKDLNMYPWLD